jgi:hypothetical protein
VSPRTRRAVPVTLTAEQTDACRTLAPFMRAGMVGLERSDWRPGCAAEDLVGPIVLAVLVEVARQLPLAEMTAALYPGVPVSRWPFEDGIDGG